jgi:hypothetical protein
VGVLLHGTGNADHTGGETVTSIPVRWPSPSRWRSRRRHPLSPHPPPRAGPAAQLTGDDPDTDAGASGPLRVTAPEAPWLEATDLSPPPSPDSSPRVEPGDASSPTPHRRTPGRGETGTPHRPTWPPWSGCGEHVRAARLLGSGAPLRPRHVHDWAAGGRTSRPTSQASAPGPRPQDRRRRHPRTPPTGRHRTWTSPLGHTYTRPPRENPAAAAARWRSRPTGSRAHHPSERAAPGV